MFNSCFSFMPCTNLYFTPDIRTSAYPLMQPTDAPPAIEYIDTSISESSISKMWEEFWKARDNSNTNKPWQWHMSDTFERTKTKETEPEPATVESTSSTVETSSVTDTETLGSSLSTRSYTGSYLNKKITDKYTGTAEQLNQMLNKKNGVLKNKGDVFIQAQEEYGINAAVLAAICINESAYGTSSLARNKNNVGGVSQGMGFRTYSSVDECIMDMARFLKSGYADKGITTISAVGAKYCPVDDPRDKTGLNSKWASNISSITKDIETLA